MLRASPSSSRAAEEAGGAAQALVDTSGSAGRFEYAVLGPTCQVDESSSTATCYRMEIKAGDDLCAIVAVRTACTSASTPTCVLVGSNGAC